MPVVEHVNWSPRAGVAIGVLPEGRAILRGGFGKFVQRTPLNVEAFPSFEPRTGLAVRAGRHRRSAPVTFATSSTAICARPKPTSATSNGISASAAVCSLKLEFLRRHGSHEYIVSPDPTRGEAAPDEHRHVRVPGTRGDDAVSRRRAAGPDRLVCLGARRRPISTTTISSSATCATRSSAPTRTT